MKYVKDGIFWFIIFYVVFISFLFIKQAFVVYDTMYKPVVLEKNEKYENVIMESKRKLQKYRVLSKTQEERACLDEIQKGINYSYQKQHANVSNYKEAKKYYYDLVEKRNAYEDGTIYNNLYNINEVCDFDKNDSRRKELSKNVLYSVIFEKKFSEDILLFLPKFENLSILGTVSANMFPLYDHVIVNIEQDIRGRLINSDINYIKLLLEMVGERYETK